MLHPPRNPVGLGQESVWDHPRPPSAAVTGRHLVVELDGRVVAETVRAVRVCETSHPPVFCIPRADVADGLLERAAGGSWCEWKGAATYWDAVVDATASRRPPGPTRTRPPATPRLRGAVAFYPSKLDRALVDGEPVRPQAGDFYGGWITAEVVGSFKGEPGALGW